MCYSLPGLVTEVNDGKVKVAYGDEIREADSTLVKVSEGDYVIVQAGFVMQKVPEKEAKEAIKLWDKADQELCF